LRAVFGLAIVVQGVWCFPGTDSTPAGWFVSGMAMIAGALLLIGFLTPIAGAAIGLGAAAIGATLLPSCTPALFDSRLSIFFGAAILAAIAFLGPGAFSVDARLFGRREIIIPPSGRPRQ